MILDHPGCRYCQAPLNDAEFPNGVCACCLLANEVPLEQPTGAERYWEARWRDERRENEDQANRIKGLLFDIERLLEGEKALRAEISRLHRALEERK
jgi:hypothetical protein